MKTQIKTITPKQAAQILETRNPKNRKMSEKFVSKLARDIRAGAFITTHQGIAFDVNGDLLDGQHRLAACVEAGVPITVPVSTGLDAAHKLNGATINTFEVIDGGRARGVGQMLQMAGFKYATHIAATAKMAVLMCGESPINIGLSVAQTHKALMYIGKSATAVCEVSLSGKIIRPTSWIRGPVAIYHASFPEKAELFLSEVCDVTGDDQSATRALSSFSRRSSPQGGDDQLNFVKAACHALWNFHHGKKVGRVHVSQTCQDWLVNLNRPLKEKLAAIIGK